MNLFKRWTSSVSTSFDWVISQVENHEALISSSLREMQQAGGKARAQLLRVQRDGQQMRRRIEELAELERVWQERALRSHDKDKERAIDCLRRRKHVAREKAALESQVTEHQRLEQQLSADLKTIDERIALLKRKRNALSARQYRTEALRCGKPEELGMIAEIDEIFERWELKLDEREAFTAPVDILEDEFLSEELAEELEHELHDLIQKHRNN